MEHFLPQINMTITCRFLSPAFLFLSIHDHDSNKHYYLPWLKNGWTWRDADSSGRLQFQLLGSKGLLCSCELPSPMDSLAAESHTLFHHHHWWQPSSSTANLILQCVPWVSSYNRIHWISTSKDLYIPHSTDHVSQYIILRLQLP